MKLSNVHSYTSESAAIAIRGATNTAFHISAAILACLIIVGTIFSAVSRRATESEFKEKSLLLIQDAADQSVSEIYLGQERALDLRFDELFRKLETVDREALICVSFRFENKSFSKSFSRCNNEDTEMKLHQTLSTQILLAQIPVGEITVSYLPPPILRFLLAGHYLYFLASALLLSTFFYFLFHLLVQKRFVFPMLQEIEKNSGTAAIARTTQNLAHDVRKPFSMLKMVLDAISSAEDPAESKEIAKASLPEVNQAMASVEGMIQDVMQIGSNSKPNQEVASCEAMIDAAVNELFRIFPEANVGVEYDLNHRHCLFIDTMRVGRVFSNILVNAVQAMNGKGNLWIKTHEENSFVEFRLGNVGSCIPKDSLPKLFDAFFTSGKKGGTGLGLAIAQKVVNEHGGNIKCESDKTENYPEGYVEFVFTLPVANELSPKRDEPLPNHSRVIHEQLLKLKKKDSDSGSHDELEQERIITKRLKTLSGAILPILIVDDEAVYRNSLAGLLTNFRGGESDVAKIPIVFAKNAAEAMQMVKEHSPFLIIQDIDLGVGSKNGIDVIKDLRQEGYQGRICVHSNRFLFDDQKTAVDAGADSVLPKPMSRAHLFKMISSSLPVETDAKIATQALQKLENKKPRIAYIDDAITFTLSWKMKLRDRIDVETFSSTTQFFKKIHEEPDFLQSFDVIVTDYHFGADDPHNGKSFAAELRKMGFEKPIFLASNGDFEDADFKQVLTGVIGKDIPEHETIMRWLSHV